MPLCSKRGVEDLSTRGERPYAEISPEISIDIIYLAWNLSRNFEKSQLTSCHSVNVNANYTVQ